MFNAIAHPSTPPGAQRPKPLRPGDRVRVVAPAGAFAAEVLARGVAYLQERGFEVVLHDKLTAPGAYYAAPLDDRAQVLRETLIAAAQDGRTRAIWAARGGSGTAQVLSAVEELSPRALSASAPWLVGFSDLTTLHACWQGAGVMSLHGANLSNLLDWSPEAQEHLFATLAHASGLAPHYAVARWQQASAPDAPPTNKAPAPARAMGFLAPEPGVQDAAASVRGPLVGGNLTVLASLCGTGVLPRWRGCILLLEDIDERPYRLDRCLNQLLAAGALDDVLAVVTGQLTRCDDAAAGLSALDLIGPTLARAGLPLYVGAPFGHEATSQAVVLGAPARIDVASGTLHVDLP